MIAALLEAQVASPDIDVWLLGLNEGRLARIARGRGIPTEIAPETGRSFVDLLRDVDGLLAQIRPDIVHSHRYKENLLSYLTARRHGAHSVVTLHGSEPPADSVQRLKTRIRQSITHRIARWVGAEFVAVSADLRERLGLSPSRCIVIPNGVKLPAHVVERRPLSVGTARSCIGWVGRLVPIKGLSLLLEAFALLPPSLAATRLLLIGDGPERAALEELSRRLGLEDRVEFAGFVADPAPSRARMALFALPSEHEGIPVALLEAMAEGIPCVAAAVGGIVEIDGGTGSVRLVRSRDPADWAREISLLLADPALCESLGARGRARVAQSFALDVTAGAYLALYRKVAAEQVKRRQSDPDFGEGAAEPASARRER
ncbi:MAG: glycosyltransferase family 4 protein [Deltaproteobacteria bacterium]|nr:glycosyltransferase family 4 protein [Deltaproteobacteria bacterium]